VPGQEGGYVLPEEVVFGKIRELVSLGGTEILIQGGLNPALKLEYYENLFRAIKANFAVQIHGLSPVEIIYLAKISHLSERECLVRLQAAGLDSIPGAGAEILVEAVRSRSPRTRTPRPRGWISCGRRIASESGPASP